MNRKAFLKNSLFGTAGIGLALNNLSCDSMKRITILHTNDVHSHIEPFSKDHSEFPNKGGFERRSTIINKIRKENPTHRKLFKAMCRDLTVITKERYGVIS